MTDPWALTSPGAVIAAERLVTPHGVTSPGWLATNGGRIAALGQGEPPAAATHRAHWALPGFIDMHVHGGGGASFTEGGPDEARTAAAFHRAHGTTRIIASLVTAPLAELEHRLEMLSGLADEGVIDGIHLEGPFLSAVRCGAQDPRYLGEPSVAAFARLLAAGRGWLKMITIAPELPGAAEVIRAAHAAGVIAAAGHTDASAAVTEQAVAAGVSHATHLFNGMRPLGHREPGPAGALLDRQVTCEVIADGTHLHDAIVRLTARAAGPGNLVLITDAMAAAGMPDGDYRLGELDVTVAAGVSHATHLFNGMRPLGHREPGPAGALLDHRVTCEVVADGHHLDDIIIRLTARSAGPGNLVLITDAMAAAGMPDGDYRLGELAVTVSAGVARLVDADGVAGSIAGSTATMELVTRRAIAAVGLPVADVAAAASTTPARRLGLAEVTGSLTAGLAADIALLDEDFRLSAVIARGERHPSTAPAIDI